MISNQDINPSRTLQKYKTFTYETTNLEKKLLNQIFPEKHGHAISLIYSKDLK